MNEIATSAELALSVGVSTGVCLSVNAEPLLTAIITFGVSVVTIVGGELIKFLVAWLQKKRNDINKEGEDNKDGKNKS